jgi:hypothetical protein
MTRFILLVWFLIVTASAQEAILRTAIAKQDWRLTSPEDIRFGQISIAKLSGGERMKVTALQVLPPNPSGEFHIDFPSQSSLANRQENRRATWIWNTVALMRDSLLRRELAAFIQEQRINVVFLQLPFLVEDSLHSQSSFDNALLSTVVRLLKKQDVEVHALEGSPSYIRAEQQPELLKLIHATLAYNRWTSPDARFDGVHLDVEPYLMPGFGGARREEIFASYLTMLRRVRVALTGSELVFGADIPCWFDNADEWTGIRNEVTENGNRMSVLDCVLEIVDEIGIMSYRTEAHGEGGVVMSAMNEVDAAGRRGKRAYVALETESLSDEFLAVIRQEPYAGLPISGNASYHLSMRTRGDSIEVWYIPDAECEAWRLAWKKEESEQFISWAIHRLIPVPASRLTFAGMNGAQLENVEAEVRKTFDRWKGFAGVAVHHWESLRKIRQK